MDEKRYLSKSELVFDVIWGKIIRGELAPGERFSAKDVAKELDVSRTPVNEAMKKLAEYGVIRIMPNVGYEVIVLKWKDIEDIMQIECLLETQGLLLNRGQMDKKIIDELFSINKKTLKALRSGDRRSYYQLTDEFHIKFIGLSGSRILKEIFVKSRHYAGWNDGKMLEMSVELEDLIKEHDLVLSKLSDNEVEEAIDLLKNHSEKSINLVEKSLHKSRYPGIQ